MNKHYPLFLLVFFAASFGFLGSCSDDDTAETDPREETLQMLSGTESKSWMLSTIHLNGANVTNLYLDECNRDDIYVFYRNGEGEILGNELKCIDGEPDQIASGTWELHEDLKTMNLNLSPFFDEDVEILDLTDDRLQIRKEEDGETVMATYLAVE